MAKGKKQMTANHSKLAQLGRGEVSDRSLEGALMFNWNGHLWEAYEVLGLSPGAELEEVEAAYSSEIIKIDKHSKAFITMAYDLIVGRLKKAT